MRMTRADSMVGPVGVSVDDLVARVMDLERGARRRRVATTSLFVVVGAAFICGQAGTQPVGEKLPDMIEARAFNVRDEKGRLRARLATEDGLTQLGLYNEDGSLVLRAFEDGRLGYGVELRQRGKNVGEFSVPFGRRAYLSLSEPGASIMDELLDTRKAVYERRKATGLPTDTEITDDELKEQSKRLVRGAAITLSLGEGIAPYVWVELRQSKACGRSEWGVGPDGSGFLSFKEANETERVRLQATNNGPTGVLLSGSDGKLRGLFATSGDSGDGVAMLSNGEHILWKAP